LGDETGDSTLAGLGRLAGDWITQGLHEAGGTRVVAWPAARAAVEGSGTGDVAATLRRVTGALSAVVGSVYRLGDTLRFQVEVIDTRRGIVLAAPPPVMVHRDSALAGVRLLRDRVMGALAVQQDERLAGGGAFAARPPTYAAYRVFDRALDDYDRYRYGEARAGMLEAWRLDTTFTAALVYAAHAAWNESNRALADSLVTAVLLRRDALSGYHVAMAEVMRASLVGDVPGALLASERAVQLAPGSRARYNMAQALLALNRPAAALAQLDSLDPDLGPLRGWPAYWSQRAYNAHLLGDHQDELESARAMAVRHPSQRVPGVIAARALAADGRLELLDSTLAAHEHLDPDTYWSQGAMRVVAGEELAAHGQPAAATRYFEDAERWLRARLAIHPENESHRYWLASALIGRGEWQDALAQLHELIGTDPERLLYRGMAASLTARLGNEVRAAEILGEADPADRGEWLVFRARIAALGGDTDRALALLGDALRAGVGNWHWTHGTAQADLAAMLDDPRYQRLVAVDRPR
jgi:tetratricopeptide (TPR) repeat protein